MKRIFGDGPSCFFPWGNIPKEVEKKKRVHRCRSEKSPKVEKSKKGNTITGGKYPQRSKKEEKGTPLPVGNVPKSGKIKKKGTPSRSRPYNGVNYN